MSIRSMSFVPSVALILAACSSDVGVQNQVNVPPAVAINSPVTGDVFETAALLRFEGVVSDGNRLADLTRVWWSSDQDGELGLADLVAPDEFGNTVFETALSDGLHTITLAATDGAGETAFDTISVEVIGGPQLPTVEYIQPTDFDSFELGEDIDIVALVSDPQDSPDTLWVTLVWTAADSGGVETFLYEDVAAANGSVRVTWPSPDVGAYNLVLAAEDTEGNITDASLTLFVADPNDVDVDGDGFSPNSGDCDDNDASAFPGADETCGDGDDNDCNGAIDDADLDQDQHIDVLCAAYTGALPVDDCNDNNGTILPGAPESLNGIDDDCDTYIDEGTVVFDDDGDCFCEQGPCTGSFENCPSTVLDGDCNDADDTVHPGAFDTPDTNYADEDCDGIDGVVTDGVFVAPGGSDSGNCAFGTPCSTISYAVGRAAATNKQVVNIRAGNYSGSFAVTSNVTLVGGFDSTWARDVTGASGHTVRFTGTTLSGEYVGIQVRGATFAAMDMQLAGANVPNSGIGKSSYTIHSASGSTVTLERVTVDAGDAGPGAIGSSGSSGPEPANRNGSRGGNGENHGTFDACRDSQAAGGAPGTNSACSGATTGGRGGLGGKGDERCCTFANACAACSLWNNDACDAQGGSTGSNASTLSGTSGRGGSAGSGDSSGSCTPSVGTGSDGNAGVTGTDGAGGNGSTGNGSLASSLWWRAGSGAAGWIGIHGGGGGGGGGAGACDDGFFGSDFGGNGGGGGGAGGCRAGTSGQGGSGGGGSFAIFAAGGVVTLLDSRLNLGSGGRGGNGGDGGSGGDGGTGNQGGQSTGFEAGRGGNGGRGGHSGGGGGGGGGHSVGVYSVGAVVTTPGTTASSPAPGVGGAGGRSARNTSTTNGQSGNGGQGGLVVTH